MSRLHRRLLDELVRDIVCHEYGPGERLPRETDLAARFDVSRGIVREALRGLEERKLVRIRHGIGAIVAPRAAWDALDADVLPALLRAPDGAAMIAQTIDLQRLLEGRAVELAARSADERALDALHRAWWQLRQAADEPRRPRFAPALAAVHHALIAASRHQALWSLTIDIATALAAIDGPETLPSLARTVDAVATGRAALARESIDAHLRALGDRLLHGR